MANNIKGKCAICGNNGQLTFEHIPLKSTGNDRRVKLYDTIDIIEGNIKPWNVENLIYTNQQKGVGLYSLCANCNNYTGRFYGQSYKDFSDAFSNFIYTHNVLPNEGFVIEDMSFKPLEILKQVLSFFTSIQYKPLSEEISTFIMDKELTLDNLGGYRVFMYLNLGKIHKLLPPIVKYDSITKDAGLISEISTFPFGFNLYYPDENVVPRYGTEITHFSQYPYGVEEIATEFEILCFESNNIFPLDFRSQDKFL